MHDDEKEFKITYGWTILFLVFTFGGALLNQIWRAFLGGVCFVPMIKELEGDRIRI